MQEYLFRSLLDVKVVRDERKTSFVSRVKENVYLSKIRATPLLGTEDSTIRRLVPGVATGFLKGAETQRQRNGRYRVVMTRVLFSIRLDSIWGGSWNLSRFWGESNS